MDAEFPIKVREVKVRHKSGVTYVERRQYRYDPKLGHNVVLKSERIGKIDPETNQIVPCRPKRKKNEPTQAAEPVAADNPSATRARTGLSDLFDWAGKSSGLEECVRHSFNAGGDADKILSVARYLVATGDPVNRIDSWQLDHDVPYRPGLSPDVCYELFDQVGLNETGMQSLFARLAHLSEEGSSVLAFDSTTTSSYSQNLEPYIRSGFNKAGDNLHTFKLCTFYSVFSRLPVAFEMQPGNLADVTCMKNAIKRVQSYGLKSPEFIVDNGFAKKSNLVDMLRNHIQFTARVTVTDSWVAKHLDEIDEDGSSVRSQLEGWDSICPFDHATHGVSRTRMVELSWTRERSRGERTEGDVEKKTFRLYLHYYRNANRTHIDREALKTRVMTVRQILESGVSVEALSDADQVIAEKYLICTRVGRGGKLRISMNTEALQRAERNYGIFCLVSNKHKDPWVVLKRYRMRNRIEESYRVSKSELDGDRARVWSVRKVRGKELCRMVALGYHFFLQTAINKVRLEAARLAADENLTLQDRKAYDGVRKWLEATTLRGLMAWFDCVETVTVKNEFARKRWSTEMIKRDQLFLKMLYSEEVQTFGVKDLEETLPAEDSE